MILISWDAAIAYASWYSDQRAEQWRLPFELEWEKSARGVDGRIYPWGNRYDHSYACNRSSHQGRMLPNVLNSYPIDESVYGVRGCAGNISDWTASIWDSNGPQIRNHRPIQRLELADESSGRVSRGGAWLFNERSLRCATRNFNYPKIGNNHKGFRLARALKFR